LIDQRLFATVGVILVHADVQNFLEVLTLSPMRFDSREDVDGLANVDDAVAPHQQVDEYMPLTTGAGAEAEDAIGAVMGFQNPAWRWIANAVGQAGVPQIRLANPVGFQP
jgi:hypothetical protein